MKRLWTFTAVLLAAALVGVTLWHLLPHGAPEPSDLYRRYEHQPGVRVGFIESYRFDDSTHADVVTFEALDSAGWHWMQQEFDLQLEFDLQQALCHEGLSPDTSGTSVILWQCDDGQNMAFCLPADSALCLVHPASESDIVHIIKYYVEKLKQ